MITIKFKGGLGNQLFQYAYAKVLSWKTNHPLGCNLEYFEGNCYRQFMLDEFEPNDWIPGLSRDKCELITDYHKYPTGNKDLFLDGYFQEVQLLNDYKLQLQKLILIGLIKKAALNVDWMDQFSRNSTSVIIHVRRTDYLLSINKSIHGLCDKIYYQKAISLIKERVTNPQFYVVSDEPVLAEHILEELLGSFINISRFILEQDKIMEKDITELLLMTSCQHFIIANSTFSWWAAWLSTSTKKIVIAPKLWYADPLLQATGDKIYDIGWIKL